MNDATGPGEISFARRTEVLSQIPAFADFPPQLVGELAGSLREEAFAADAVIVREGDVGEQLFVIESGRAEATTKGAAGPVVLATLGTGDMFGEIALLTSTRRRQATVKATAPLRALTLSATDFERALVAFPDVRIEVVTAAEAMLSARFLKRKAAQ